MPFHAMRRHLSRLARCLALLACHALLVATAAHAQKAIEKDASGNLTASYSVGNRTLTIASGGTLNAVAGSNVILAGTTTLSGNITSNATLTGGTLANVTLAGNSTLAGNLTSNATVTHSGALTVTGNSTLGNATITGNLTLSGNNNTATPNRTIDLGTGPSSDGYFYPLKWGSGSRYTLGGGYSTFQGVPDHLGNFAYNQVQTAGDVNFGLGFEARFQNAPQGTDTEHYYFWNGPIGVSADSGGRTSRRIWQINTSWGTGYSAPPARPMGYSEIGYDVNKFYVDNGANYNGEFLIDFTSSPKRLTWQNAMTLNGALTIGGAITQSGTNTNTLSGATTIIASNASYAFASSASDSLLTLTNAVADTGARFVRGTATGEHITIGAAAGGGIFGGSPSLSNAFVIQRAGNPTIRDLYFRSYDGTTYTQDGRLTAAGLWILGEGADDTVNRLQVYGNALFTASNGNTVRILNAAQGAGNAGIWLNDASSPSATNYALLGSGTNTVLNSPNGSILFRNGNNDRATLTSTSFAIDLTTQATSTTVASLQTDGGLGVVKKTFLGDDLTIVPAGDTASTIFFSGTTVAGNPSIWFRQASPSNTNYALSGSSSNTILNVPTGGTVRLRVANSDYLTLTSSALVVQNAPVTLPSTDGSGYIQVVEQSSSPAAGSANSARIYAKDNGSGKTQLIVRFASGAEQVLATEP